MYERDVSYAAQIGYSNEKTALEMKVNNFQGGFPVVLAKLYSPVDVQNGGVAKREVHSTLNDRFTNATGHDDRRDPRRSFDNRSKRRSVVMP